MSLERKNQIIRELLFDISFNDIEISETLRLNIEKIRFVDGEKRKILIQKTVGYIEAMKDYYCLDIRICDAIINKIHMAQ